MVKKFRVREGKPRDKGLFRKLWKAFLKENSEQGHWILPNSGNLDVATFYFDKYVNKEAEGVVLFVAQNAVLMWGEDLSPITTIFEKAAQGWGTYVDPDHRKNGMSAEMRKQGKEKLRELGFTHVVGSVMKDNHPSHISTLKSGANVQPIEIFVMDIKEE